MPSTTYYCPILFDKRAELHALANLSERSRTAIAPLVQIRQPEPSESSPPSWNPLKALMDRILDCNDGLIGCWGSNNPIRIDLRALQVNEFEQPPMEAFFDQCRDVDIHAVPVTGRDQPQLLRDAAARAARRLGHGACVRVTSDDLGIGTAGLRLVMNELDLPRNAVDLVLDLGNLPADNSFLLSRIVGEELAGFRPLGDWRSVAVIGSSFPQNLSSVVDHNSFNLLPRIEMNIWRRLQTAADVGPAPAFGDYGIVSADPPPGHRGAANIRYTVNDQWYVERGHPIDKAASDDYLRLAKNLRRSDFWKNETHCPGCSFIQTQIDTGRPGNATQWRKAGFDHHFAVVRETLDLAA